MHPVDIVWLCMSVSGDVPSSVVQGLCCFLRVTRKFLRYKETRCESHRFWERVMSCIEIASAHVLQNITH